MLTPREATEAPREATEAPRSRSPLSPTEVTKSATVRLFLILSALLCSVNKTATCLGLRLRSRSPHSAQHSTSNNIIIRIFILVT